MVAADGVGPERWIYFLHGIFGAGRNWGSVARRLARERPGTGAVLVDLRQHGGSQGFAPPHTITAAAADVARLARDSARPVAEILGHSFGGKVALQLLRDGAAAQAGDDRRADGDADGGGDGGVARAWIVDSTPASYAGPRGSAWQMLATLRSLPARFDSRGALVAALGARGVAAPTAQWMATNLQRAADGGYVWRFDLDAMEALLRDFFRVDLWDVVESPPAACTIHFVKAAESGVLDDAAVRRIRAAGERTGRVRLDVVAGGHWLNADNPEAVLDLLLAGDGASR